MKLKSEIKRGQTITYTKQIMFKGTEKVTAKVVALGSRTALLDNGDEIMIY